MSVASLEEALPPNELLLLDTTAVVSYFKGTEAVSTVATHVIDRFVIDGRNPSVVSAVTAMELLVSAMKDGDDVLYRHMMFFLTYTRGITIAEVSLQVAHEAASIRAAYNFKTPDSLIMGTGQLRSARYFVCNDHEWKRKLGRVAPLRISVCHLGDHLPFP